MCNTLFARRVGALDGGAQLLVAAGFRERPDGTLEFPAHGPLGPVRARLLELQAVLPTMATFAQAFLDKEQPLETPAQRLRRHNVVGYGGALVPRHPRC